MADPSEMTVFTLLRARMSMLSERQKVLAQNVANVSTPGYVPHDVDQKSFASVLETIASAGPGGPRGPVGPAGPSGPDGSSSSGFASHPGVRMVSAPDSETTLDGNAVVVEEQMMKIAETRMDFETMTGLYQKSLGLLRLASRSPTR
ncbi:MAG: flagellar basal body protein [Hyphomonadaceae bacterium]